MLRSNLFLVVPGIIFISILLKIYFLKKRLVIFENKIYVKLIIACLVSLLLNALSIILTWTLGVNSVLSIIASKLYLASILGWLFILTMYVYAITFKKAERFSLTKTSSLLKILMGIIPVGIVFLVAIFILPIKIIDNGNIIYYSDYSPYLIYAINMMCVIGWLIRYIIRYHYIKSNKCNCTLHIIMIVLLANTIQIIFPQSLIFSFAMYFLTFTLYFGLENPDLNLVKEIEDGKKRIEETELSLKDTLLKVSHAIRTPLNAIAGFAQSILEGSSEDINEDVTQIKTSSEKLLGVLNNILDIPDDDMQMYKLVFGSYNPEALLKQIVALAKERIKTDKVELNIMVDDNLPAFLFGDSIRIKEIVLNLLVNAIDHTKEGNINLDIGSLTIGNICRLTITVKDTGSGITQDKLETIFEPRVNTNKELAEGISELNLATIKNIVESMNGHISLESEYRDGTVVKIVIDQKIGIDPNAINQDDSIEECKRRVYLSKKVLIVDDDKINLKVASRLLMSYGVVTDEVSSGFQCIEKITGGEKYDLILLDDWMPQMGGVATLKQLKNIEGFNIPVVALTANAMAGMKDKYIKDGFDDFIPKPVERKELSRVMEKFLKEQ